MSDTATMLDLLRAAYERLAEVHGRVAPGDATRQSYDDDWTVAQVFSHLGSGAEIFELIVEAGRAGAAAPGSAEFAPIWERWNEKDPERQVADAMPANRALVEAVAALDDAERAAWRLDLFGMERDLANVLAMRLSEVALHTWDVDVALDPAAVLGPEAVVAEVLDGLGPLVGFLGKPAARRARIAVVTTAPVRELTLSVGPDQPALTTGATTDADASLQLPAEAFVRLVYGRLDEAHTPPLESVGVDLAELRPVFPGF